MLKAAEDKMHSVLSQSRGHPQQQELIEDAELMVEDRELDIDLQVANICFLHCFSP